MDLEAHQPEQFTEYEYEKEESKNHMRRALIQSLRDVRMTGFITKGEQELMEQIGVNPSKLQKLLRAYVANEENQETWSVDEMYSFVNQLAEELIDVYKVDVIRMNLMGLNKEPKPDFSYINRVGLKQETQSGEE
jgi:hypothetical protein